MKCKNCNNEIISGQTFCNVCGTKVEETVNLNDVDKTSMSANGIVNYDFDFSDQIKSNTPNPNNITVRPTNNVIQNQVPQAPIQNPQTPIQNNITSPEQQKSINNQQVATEPVQNVTINQEPSNVVSNKNYTVLGRNDHKHSHAPIIIICILSILVGGGYFVYNTFFYDSVQKPNIEENNKNEETPSVEEEPKDDKENVEEDEKESTESTGSLTVPINKISYSGVTLEIPTTLLYRYEEETLIIYPSDEEWAAAIALSEGSYAILKTKKAELAAEIEKSGINVGNYGIKFYGGTEWLTYETEVSGANILVIYVGTRTNNYGALTIQTLDNTYDYNILRTLAPIIQSIK